MIHQSVRCPIRVIIISFLLRKEEMIKKKLRRHKKNVPRIRNIEICRIPGKLNKRYEEKMRNDDEKKQKHDEME